MQSKLRLLLALVLSLVPLSASQGLAQDEVGETLSARIESRLRERLVDLHQRRGFPGVSAAFVLPDGAFVKVAVGLESKADETPLTPEHRLLSGSIGKTYVTAAAHRRIAAGELALDEPAATYLGDLDWWKRMPNADTVSVRQLLRHESGLPRYIFEDGFWDELLAAPDRVWKPEELLAFVFDDAPLFPAGKGWAYADTNYIVVGMILERIGKAAFYDDVQASFLTPLGLKDTIPTNTRTIDRMAQGHVVMSRQFGYPELMLEKGVFRTNVQFEWCGGGWASTPLDLARWAKLLFGGEALEGDYLATLLDAVPAPGLGPGKRYGLGVIVQDTDFGPSLGHEGFMPGYLSALAYLPDPDLAGAVQLNTDDVQSVGDRGALLQELFALVIEELEG